MFRPKIFKPAGFIFDGAGTLVNPGSLAPVQAFQQVFKNRGVEITRQQAAAPMGLGKKDHLAALLRDEHIMRKWMDRHDSAPTAADLDSLYHEYLPVQKDIVRNDTVLVPHSVATLQALKERGILLGLTTGYDADTASVLRDFLREKGVEFDGWVSNSDVARGRPHPDMIYECLRQMNLGSAENVVNVGDTELDIKAGLAAGCGKVVGIAPYSALMGLSFEDMETMLRTDPEQYTEKLENVRKTLLDAGADRVIDQLKELLLYY